MITSLPLILINLLNLRTKTILNFWLPKTKFLEKNYGCYQKKKIFMITCPTKDLKKKFNRVQSI